MNKLGFGLLLSTLLIPAWTRNAPAQDLAPGDKEPLLRLEAGGPTSYVTALAFSPDGKMLCAAGWDKVVRVWKLDNRGKFVLERDLSYRVPLGPGLSGAINAIALSDDGNWLAAAGLGVARAGAGFRQAGLVLPTLGGLGDQSRLDQGTIYLFNTKNQKAKLLRGHTGEVYSLSFAPIIKGESPKLISLGREWNGEDKTFEMALRSWDIEKGAGSVKLGPLPATSARPDLAVWRKAGDQSQVLAAVNLGDGKLRVWKIGSKEGAFADANEVPFAINAFVLSEKNRLVTASYGLNKARLRAWSLGKDGTPESDDWSATPGDLANAFPRALAPLASGANGKVDYAASVVRMQKKAQDADLFDYRLQIFSLGQDNFGQNVADQLLWNSDLKQPVLAASPRGQYLAVAGNGKHEIQIYTIKDLIRGETRPSILRGEGANFRYVSFATNKADELGIVLNESAKKSPGGAVRPIADGDVVFDFAKRGLSGQIRDWTSTSPATSAWQARLVFSEREGPAVVVFKGDEEIRRIQLRPENTVTDFAWLPPDSKVAKVPLLAVAFHNRGQPTLALYNAQSGDQIRQYSGHADPIHCVAFSPDGRLLVSAAEDQTISVWSLADLEKTLDHLGMLKGVAIQKKRDDKRLSVAAVSSTSPATGKLQENDIVESLTKGNVDQPLTEVKQYYDLVSKQKPGSTVSLKVQRAGDSFDVVLPVNQGIDDQKPLFSLFFTRDGQGGKRHWIGWNPIGPYEASSARAEEYLGWHFNTGQADEPARFAGADQYHKAYYREGVLKQLIASGDPTQIPDAPPVSPPRMTLLIDDKGDYPLRDDKGQLLVRHSDARLKVLIQDGSLETLKSLTWKVDSGQEAPVDLKDLEGDEVIVPLKLARGLQTIQVVGQLTGADSLALRTEVVVRHQPPAPRLELGPQIAEIVVKEARFKLQGKVIASLDNQTMVLRVIQRHDKLAIEDNSKSYLLKQGEARDFEQPLNLKPGVNQIEVAASNKDALAGNEEWETSRRVLKVVLEETVPAPLISVTKVTSATASDTPRIDFQPGLPVLVHQSEIKIHGRIEGDDKLASAVWRLGDKDKPHSLGKFAANKAESFDFEETVSLKPGKQVVRFSAATAKSAAVESVLEVVFQPPLPTLELAYPRQGQVFYGDKDSKEIALTGTIGSSAESYECQVKTLVNGQELPESIRVDAKAGEFNGKALLHPGSNRIQVKLTNAWGAEFISDAFEISYFRPPRILEVTAPLTTRQGLADLTVKIRSAMPISTPSLALEVNRKKQILGANNDLKVIASKNGTYLVEVKHVALEGDSEGKKKVNQILVWANNKEGQSLEPGRASISFEPAQLPSEVTFLEPRNNSLVSTRNMPVRFRVTSLGRLSSVSLIQDGKTVVDSDVRAVKKNEDGKFELTAEPTVNLKRGLNTLQLVARNEGGQSTASVVVNYPYKPVRLEIDRLEPKEFGSKSVECEVGQDCMIRFPRIDSGRVRVRGRVIWDDPEDDERLAKTKIVRVFVNGFQQIPGVLSPPASDKRVREFQAGLLLNEEKDNKVGITIPGLEMSSSNRTVFVVDCAKPVREQRLHLLVLSFKPQDEKKLKDQFLSTLQGDQANKNRLYSYGPLTGYYVRQEYINTQVSIIRTRIKELANSSNPCNDVVVFYYQGGETVKPQGVVFRTSDCNPTAENPEPANALTCKRLVNYFAETPGAHFVFFDVDKVDADKDLADKNEVTGWDDNFPQVKMHVAMMHYAWVGRDQEPVDAQLLARLSKALPKKITLIDMEKELQGFTKSLLKVYPDSIRFTVRKPVEMEKIVLGP